MLMTEHFSMIHQLFAQVNARMHISGENEMDIQDGVFFIAHLLHSPFCERCRDEVGFSWRRFLVKLGWGRHKEK